MAGVEEDTLGVLKLICAEDPQGFFFPSSFQQLPPSPAPFPPRPCPCSVQSAVASGTPSPCTPATPALGCLSICSSFLHPNVFSRLPIRLAGSCTGPTGAEPSAQEDGVRSGHARPQAGEGWQEGLTKRGESVTRSLQPGAWLSGREVGAGGGGSVKSSTVFVTQACLHGLLTCER